MSQDRDTLRAVSWLEVFPGLHLFSSLRMAINPRMLVLAAIAMVGTSAGFRTVGAWFSGTADRGFLNQIEANNPWPWERDVVVPPVGQLFSADMWRDQSPLLHAWSTISAPFIQVYSPEGSVSQFAYWLVCGLWSLALWAFFGGAITRIAAVWFARNENLAWGQVAGFVRPHWTSYFSAPLFPILGTFLVAGILGGRRIALTRGTWPGGNAGGRNPVAVGAAGRICNGLPAHLAVFRLAADVGRDQRRRHRFVRRGEPLAIPTPTSAPCTT